MTDRECAELLRWLLPRLHLCPAGFRRVRRQVCKRLTRRMRELGLEHAADYRQYLESHAGEWRMADALCTVTISRFYRDREVFAFLGEVALPKLASEARRAGRSKLLAWSAGCGSGEEPYTLSLVWELAASRALPGMELEVLATDIDEVLLRRAREGVYPRGCLAELPSSWLDAAFARTDGEYRLRNTYRERVRFRRHDVREAPPDGPFDLLLCRNLAFTYFDERLQAATARTLRDAMREGGVLVLGRREVLPAETAGFAPWPGAAGVYRTCAFPKADARGGVAY